jgi:hypothetical protein
LFFDLRAERLYFQGLQRGANMLSTEALTEFVENQAGFIHTSALIMFGGVLRAGYSFQVMTTLYRPWQLSRGRCEVAMAR